MKISGFQKLTLLDFPGKLLVLFLHKDVTLDVHIVRIQLNSS